MGIGTGFLCSFTVVMSSVLWLSNVKYISTFEEQDGVTEKKQDFWGHKIWQKQHNSDGIKWSFENSLRITKCHRQLKNVGKDTEWNWGC